MRRTFRIGFLFSCLGAPYAVIGGCSASSPNEFDSADDAGKDVTTTDATRARDSATATDGAPSNDAASDAATDAAKDAAKDSAGDALSDAAPDCSNIPVVTSRPGPFCFNVADASPDGAAASVHCASSKDEICCSPDRLDSGSFPSSSCIAPGTASVGYVSGSCDYGPSPTGTEWHCTQASHCPNAGEKCCAIKSDAGTPMPGQDNDFPGCPVYFQSGRFVGGTRCQTSCGAGELTLCASDAECSAGKCVPVTVAGRYVGYCRL